MITIDALTVRCSWCKADPGERCWTFKGLRARRPHKARVRLAYAVAAHADPALSDWPELGMVSACGVCNSGLPQRHRIVDAIAGALEAGDGADELAQDYGVPLGAVKAVQGWAARWPGAWS